METTELSQPSLADALRQKLGIARGQPSMANPMQELPQQFKQGERQPRDALINSIVAQESGGNPNAKGGAGELGLMQILPATAAQYGVHPEQLGDPATNRQVGTRYFGDLLKRYKGNEFLALVAYNSGPHRVDKGILLPQSVKYATSVLKRASSPLPRLESQTATTAGPRLAPQSSILGRLAASLESGLEGTAYAEEPPQMASRAPTGGASQASLRDALRAKLMQGAVGGPPRAPAGVPATSALHPAAAPGLDPAQMRPTISFGPGGLHLGLQGPTTPTQIKTQESAGNVVLGQVDDAIGYYDKNIKPRESEFTGSLMENPSAALHGYAQWPEYSHSRLTGLIGGKVDPAVSGFYSKAGPIIAEQMRSLIGGRVGAYMLQGPLAPHLPNPERDTLPMMREKLGWLKENVPIILQNINKMRAQGTTDDQIIGGASDGSDLSADEQDLLNQYRR